MPPKKKGASKKPAKARTPALINGLTKEELSKDQLEEHITRLREELDREREERNYFQLERDRFVKLREVTERTLDETKAQQKKLDKVIEDEEASHLQNIKVYRQKMKHLLCEHQNTLCELKTDGLLCSETVQNEQTQLEMELHKEMRSIMVETYQLQSEIPVQELKMKHDAEMTATMNKWEKHIAELALQNDCKTQMMQQEQDNLKRSMISDLEDEWTKLICMMQEAQTEDMLAKQLALEQMQKEAAECKQCEDKIEVLNEKYMQKKNELISIVKDNKHLMEVISKANKENAGLQKKVRYYSEKTDTMEKIKAKEVKVLKSDIEALDQQLKKLQLEKEEINRTFTQRLLKTEEEANAKCLDLEQEEQVLLEDLEERQTQLNSVLSAPNLDHVALKMITDKAMAPKDFLQTCETKQQAL